MENHGELMSTGSKIKTSTTNAGPATIKRLERARAVRAAKLQPNVRVLIADDHPVVRKGLTNYLTRQPRLEVIGEAADGAETLAKAKELAPDLILMDIDMPKLNGLTAAEILHRENPQVKVLILSGHPSARYAVQIIKSGACGSISKEAPTDELLQAIETVVAGGSYFSADTARAALDGLAGRRSERSGPKLTSPRERDVLVAITDGLSSKQIADRLGMSLRTVETHRERIMRKLNIRNVAGLTKYALLEGLISLPDAS
jgi:two-component system nitrate/nitrite response regulator NarL